MDFKRRMYILLMIFALTLILSGMTLNVVSSYKADVHYKEYLIDKISNNYDSFKKESSLVVDSIESFNDNLSDYFNSMAEKNEGTVSSLESLDNRMDDFIVVSSELEETCNSSVDFDSDSAQRCVVFKTNYKIITANYVAAFDKYNDSIEEYNEWAKEKDEELIEKYSGKYYDIFSKEY